MYWEIYINKTNSTSKPSHPPHGRFVLHRHQDERGPHLDLRIELGDYLVGWRLATTNFENKSWAEEKMPHPRLWLDQDGDAIREDSGVFYWLTQKPSLRQMLLVGKHGEHLLEARACTDLSPNNIQQILSAIRQTGASPDALPSLIRDGILARQRAIARLCGLGRELDGNSFNEDLWRKTLHNLSLDEISDYLRTFEVRYDRAYPPQPISQPEPINELGSNERTLAAWEILHESEPIQNNPNTRYHAPPLPTSFQLHP